MRADGRAEGNDEANSCFFVILRNVLKKRTEHPIGYISPHSETVSRKLQSTDETIFRSLIHHTRRIRTGRSGVRFTEAARDTSLLENEQTGWEAQPAFHSEGTRRYPIPRVQRPRYDADHLPPFITEVKNEWSCISTPHICLHDSYIGNYTFTISESS